MHRIRRAYTGSYALTFTAYGADGAEAAATSGTVTILDSAGTAIVTDAPCGVSDGDLTYSLDVADADKLDTYECRWTAIVSGTSYEFRTQFELVGDFIFELSDLRAHDNGAFQSADYLTATLADARVWVEQRMEKIAGVAFVPRGARETIRGTGSNYLMLTAPRVRDIYSIVEDGTEWSLDQLAAVQVRGGILVLDSGSWSGRQYVIHYEHGHPVTPTPVRQAGLILAAEYLIASNLRSRALSESTDVGFMRLSYAAEGRVGIPEVDGVLGDYKERSVRIG